MANINRPSSIADISNISEILSVERANRHCDFLLTALDKHAPPSLQKVINYNSSACLEALRDSPVKTERKTSR